jgi:soluble lytic murein transglycosylase-like protein
MGIPTRLSIQDYFNQRGTVGLQPQKSDKASADAGLTSTSTPFQKALDGARASSFGTAQGLSIQDYMQRRIPSHRPTAVGKVPSAPLSPSSMVPVPKKSPAQGPVSKLNAPQKAAQIVQGPFDKALTGDRRKISASIDRAAAQFGLPPALINAVVKAESNYQVRALSPAGAQGLMQLMPATARELGVADPYDIDQNIQGGAKYLRSMLDRFDGDLNLALSAYNAGPGTVARYAGNVPYAETRTYVQRVLRYIQEYSPPEVT